MKATWMLLFCIVLTACGKYYRPDGIRTDFKWYTEDQVGVWNNEQRIDLAKFRTEYGCPVLPPGDAKSDGCDGTQKVRAIQDLISLSNDLCSSHLANTVSGANGWNVGTGTITNVLASVAALGTNSLVQGKYAAGAVLSNSTRSLVNSEVYVQALASSIVRAIQNKRALLLEDIERNLDASTGGNTNKYTFEEARRDVEAYHDSCSFYVGVAEISKLVERRSETTQDIYARIELLRSLRSNLKESGLKETDTSVKNIDKVIEEQTQSLSGAED